MRIDQGDFVLSEAELAAALNSLGLSPNALGLQPPSSQSAEGRGDAPDVYDSLAEPLRTTLKEAITGLATPVKVVRFHYTVADESISRSLLAWSPATQDGIVAMAKTGSFRRVSVRSESEIRLLVAKLLAANDTLKEVNLCLALSSPAILVFLAIVEHFRFLRFYSIQEHTEPVNIFNRAEVETRLADAGTEDFRWPLLFLDKVMPVPVAQALTAEDAARAIKELMLAGLVAPIDETGELEAYELTEVGLWICDGLLHDVSKVALGISTFREDGEIGNEVMLLVRSSFNLFLFDLAGQQGAVASLTAKDFDELMKHTLSKVSPTPSVGKPVVTEQEEPLPPPPVIETAAKAPPEPPPSPPISQQEIPAPLSTCPSCGGSITPGQQFCEACGAVLTAPEEKAAETICPKCGAVVAPGQRFCDECGASTEQPEAGEPEAKAAETEPQQFCTKCGQPLEPCSKFCEACGADLTAPEEKAAVAYCVKCGAQLPGGTKFCTKCGTSVTGGR